MNVCSCTSAAKLSSLRRRAAVFGASFGLLTIAPVVWLLGDKLGDGPPSDVNPGGILRGKWSSPDGAVTVEFNRFLICRYTDSNREIYTKGPVKWSADRIAVGMPPLIADTTLVIQQVRVLFDPVCKHAFSHSFPPPRSGPRNWRGMASQRARVCLSASCMTLFVCWRRGSWTMVVEGNTLQKQ